jgi:hypothetical protein
MNDGCSVRRNGFEHRKFASLERRTHPLMSAAASASSASVRSMGAAMVAKSDLHEKVANSEGDDR